MYVTNGYMTPEALREHAPYLDAMNIDIKAFTENFYRKVAGAKLQPVLDTCKLARELDIHTELTYLIIPGYNDSNEELQRFASWVVQEMGPETPLHFSRFHPDHKMRNVPPTPSATLDTAYDTAKHQGIHHVYIGNVRGDKRENTYCNSCGNLCIERRGFTVTNNTTRQGKCPKCGESLYIALQTKQTLHKT